MTASDLLPRGWRWRARLVVHTFGDSTGDLPPGSCTVEDRRTGHRLAAIVPDYDWEGAWIVADGNMVTRWYTIEDAVLYAAQPRGEWDRPWPFKFWQFFGDRLRYPLSWIPPLAAFASFAVLWPWSHRGVLVEETIAVVSPLCLLFLLHRFVPGLPEPDPDQCVDGEVDGWPDDPYLSALFDSTVWSAHEAVAR